MCYELAHKTATDARILGFGEKHDGLNARQHTVDIGLLALILEVFNAPHTLDDKRSTLALGKVDGETAVCFYLYSTVMSIGSGIKLLYRRNTLLGRVHILLAGIDAHSDNNAVEEGYDTPQYRGVTNRERVETAYKDSCSHHICKVNRFSEK